MSAGKIIRNIFIAAAVGAVGTGIYIGIVPSRNVLASEITGQINSAHPHLPPCESLKSPTFEQNFKRYASGILRVKLATDGQMRACHLGKTGLTFEIKPMRLEQ